MAKTNWQPGDTFTHTDANSIGDEINNLVTQVNGRVAKAGTAATVWGGTMAQYNALPAATRNAAGFIAVISP